MHETCGEVGFFQFLGEPLHLLLLVAENYRLSDSQLIVQIEKSLALIVFLFNGDEELTNTVKSQLVTFNQNLEWIVHEFVGHLQNFDWQSC